jgi:predicted transcriptional regulator
VDSLIKANEPELLVSLNRTTLRYVSKGKTKDEISKLTGVDAQIIFETLGRLKREGYISSNDRLTEKGFRAITNMLRE